MGPRRPQICLRNCLSVVFFFVSARLLTGCNSKTVYGHSGRIVGPAYCDYGTRSQLFQPASNYGPRSQLFQPASNWQVPIIYCWQAVSDATTMHSSELSVSISVSPISSVSRSFAAA